MKKSTLTLAVLLTSTMVAANQIASNDIVNVETQGTTTGSQQTNISVEGFDISLSRENKHMAKQFGLSDQQFAQYKYLVEHTPRKYWSPDADPIVVLGVSADTEAERQYYAQLGYRMHLQRETAELAFAQSAIAVEKAATPNDKRWVPTNQLKFGFAESLPCSKTSLTSAFIKATECKVDQRCRKFIDNLIATNSRNNKLDFYFSDLTNSAVTDFVASLGIHHERFENGNITINHDDGVIRNNNLENTLLIEPSIRATVSRSLTLAITSSSYFSARIHLSNRTDWISYFIVRIDKNPKLWHLESALKGQISPLGDFLSVMIGKVSKVSKRRLE